MTIRNYIIYQTIECVTERKEKLKAIDAPKVLVEACENDLSKLKAGDLRCSGDNSLLDEEVESHIIQKGRGGKIYHVFNGNINYFPNAKYGRFIAKGEVK